MMNADAFNRLLQQPSLLKETSLAELEQLAYQFPWFGTVHVLVAAKQQLNGAAEADKLVQKAAAYSTKPLWFRNRYQLFTGALTSSTPLQHKPDSTDETDAAFDAYAVIEAEDIREKIDFVADETAFDAAFAAIITFPDRDTYLNLGTGNQGGFHVVSTTTNTVSFNNCWAIGASGYGFMLSSLGNNLSNCRAVSCATSGYYFLGSSATSATGTITDLVARSNASSGVFITSYIPFTITNLTARRNLLYGIGTSTAANLILESPLVIGNANSDILANSACNMVVNDGVFAGETGYAAPRVMNLGNTSSGLVVLNNCTSGVVSGVYTTHTVSAFLASAGGNLNVIANNTIITEATEVTTPAVMFPHMQSIALMNNDNVAGSNKSYFREGTITLDTTIFSGATPSQRMTPSLALEALYSGEFTVAVSSGQSLTPSVKVRESVLGDGTAYNGAFPRLIVKANAAIGIDTDTVLDTATAASEGAWETLTGATATVTGDGVLKFIVDCTGTTGWVNIDDWECSTTNDTMGQAFWYGGVPVVYGDNSAGGGGGSATVGYAFAG
jgi:hypothetical protein